MNNTDLSQGIDVSGCLFFQCNFLINGAEMNTDIKELDIRPVIPREKHPKIFSAFDSLKPGETFQLINDHDPLPLYYQFQAEKKEQFGWEYVEKGPTVWRVNISKI